MIRPGSVPGFFIALFIVASSSLGTNAQITFRVISWFRYVAEPLKLGCGHRQDYEAADFFLVQPVIPRCVRGLVLINHGTHKAYGKSKRKERFETQLPRRCWKWKVCAKRE